MGGSPPPPRPARQGRTKQGQFGRGGGGRFVGDQCGGGHYGGGAVRTGRGRDAGEQRAVVGRRGRAEAFAEPAQGGRERRTGEGEVGGEQCGLPGVVVAAEVQGPVLPAWQGPVVDAGDGPHRPEGDGAGLRVDMDAAVGHVGEHGSARRGDEPVDQAGAAREVLDGLPVAAPRTHGSVGQAQGDDGTGLGVLGVREPGRLEGLEPARRAGQLPAEAQVLGEAAFVRPCAPVEGGVMAVRPRSADLP